MEQKNIKNTEQMNENNTKSVCKNNPEMIDNNTELSNENSVEMAERIAGLAAKQGGTAYYVGGCVRDKLRQNLGDNNDNNDEIKDIDIEVHGLYPRQLEAILDSVGTRISVGESFRVYNLKGFSLDIAMPRKERLTGQRHTDFDVTVDPFMGTYNAALRRDFTINAIMENVLTGEIVDPFGGLEDLQNGIIRHTSADRFGEDPLRVLRGAQFAARFGYKIAPETIELCTGMNLSFLPKERVMGEVEKALLKSQRPSVFFETLRKMNQLTLWFYELEKTIGIEQSAKHHAEGDVWTHTMMVLDTAAGYRGKAKNPLGFMMAALTHDFGKILCSEKINGVIHAYDHETKGLPLIKSFVSRLTSERDLIRYVLNLSLFHMKPNVLAANKSSIKTTNRMFDQSADPEAMIYLALADGQGKIPPLDNADYLNFLTERLRVFNEYMSRPYVMGRDLVDAGVAPSKRFSEYLEYAHKLRLAGIEKESALKQILAMARKTGDYT